MSIKLDRKDVIAVADNRVFRKSKKRLYIYLAIGLALVLGGVWVSGVYDIVGYVMMALGFIIFYGWLFIMDRWQKRERKALLREWGEG